MNASAGFLKILFWVLLTLYGNALLAQDLGVYGPIYEIKEQDVLQQIAKKLQAAHLFGELEKMQSDMQEKTKAKILRPVPVRGLQKTVSPRVFTKDLTLTLPQPILDADGKVLYPRGTVINPLSYTHTPKALLFLDGDDHKQVTWALNEHAKRGDLAKLILVNGPVIDLMQEHEVRFYFDQLGVLINYFSIQQLPAIVEQKGTGLQISELKI